MDIKISTQIDGKDAQVIKDGTVIIEQGQFLTFNYSNLTFKIFFDISSDNKDLIKAETIKGEDEKIKYMKITLKVNPDELNSIFLTPAAIATISDNGENKKLYLSFNARSMQGGKNKAILFLYTFYFTNA